MTVVRANWSPKVGEGVYTLTEVARLTRTHYQRIHAWFLGRQGGLGPILGREAPKGRRSNRAPETDLTVSFHSLIDALVVARLRACGVPMHYLRKAYKVFTKEYSQRHPFSRRDLYTDGKQVFLGYENRHGEEIMKELLTQQQNWPEILKEYLTQVDYDEDTLMAARWRISEGIVIDPKRRYGKPILEMPGIPTGIIARAYAANHRDTDLVAEWYGVSQDDVSCAVAFEENLRTRVA